MGGKGVASSASQSPKNEETPRSAGRSQQLEPEEVRLGQSKQLLLLPGKKAPAMWTSTIKWVSGFLYSKSGRRGHDQIASVRGGCLCVICQWPWFLSLEVWVDGVWIDPGC